MSGKRRERSGGLERAAAGRAPEQSERRRGERSSVASQASELPTRVSVQGVRSRHGTRITG